MSQDKNEKPSIFSKVVNGGINFGEKVGDSISKAKDSMMDFIPEVDIDYIEKKIMYFRL